MRWKTRRLPDLDDESIQAVLHVPNRLFRTSPANARGQIFESGTHSAGNRNATGNLCRRRICLQDARGVWNRKWSAYGDHGRSCFVTLDSSSNARFSSSTFQAVAERYIANRGHEECDRYHHENKILHASFLS